jgi:hypothetical protein
MTGCTYSKYGRRYMQTGNNGLNVVNYSSLIENRKRKI